nr:MAG TPA: hypothetical protein [Caudoviricetes sp.]
MLFKYRLYLSLIRLLLFLKLVTSGNLIKNYFL